MEAFVRFGVFAAMNELGDTEEENDHAEKLSCSDESVFGDSAVPEIIFLKDFVDKVHDKTDENPKSQKGQE